MPTRPILALNSGSSSIKFSMWETVSGECAKLLEGEVEGIGAGESKSAEFWIKSWIAGADGAKLVDEKPIVSDIAAAFALIAKALGQPPFVHPVAIGHRMVCGGPKITENQRLTVELIDEMEHYTAFAPLHAPSEIFLMRQAMRLYPDVPNFVCFDSWFHRDLPDVTRRLPIPEEYSSMGLRRFGAHGLSYESIVAHLKNNLPSRLIVAHLGNGASVCAIRDGRSVDTSMGLTPTGGIISGSRIGDIDPGVLLFLLRKIIETEANPGKAANALEKTVNQQSGLLGVSQLSNDMRTLREAIAHGNKEARLAVDQFVYVLRKFIGAYTAVLGGLDMLVLTGGIGEHDAATRAEVCAELAHLGIAVDESRNLAAKGEAVISADISAVTVKVIPAAEDLTIAAHISRMLGVG
jgi:acetate kinase